MVVYIAVAMVVLIYVTSHKKKGRIEFCPFCEIQISLSFQQSMLSSIAYSNGRASFLN